MVNQEHSEEGGDPQHHGTGKNHKHLATGADDPEPDAPDVVVSEPPPTGFFNIVWAHIKKPFKTIVTKIKAMKNAKAAKKADAHPHKPNEKHEHADKEYD